MKDFNEELMNHIKAQKFWGANLPPQGQAQDTTLPKTDESKEREIEQLVERGINVLQMIESQGFMRESWVIEKLTAILRTVLAEDINTLREIVAEIAHVWADDEEEA